ncbi:hypothetical protein TNCV_1519821 [Trichonephila clavipes]|nr:hypothetical protein TNCV_1519821 [Trichonephila clavipes]
MVSVQSLLDQCRHRTTIVFGNLGRWPDRVPYYEQYYPYTIIFEPNFGVPIPRRLHSSRRRVREMVWKNDWEIHRDDNVSWRMVGLQSWKRALEKHVQHSHERLWPMGCHLTSHSSSTYKASQQAARIILSQIEATCLSPVPIELSISTIPRDGSHPWESCKWTTQVAKHRQ